ncbi:MAG: hypothetical protein IIU65_05840 [Clostridia bacterium]|jgi:hypothetical protein|nr:hypothetical protein [Clostridia bacterium]
MIYSINRFWKEIFCQIYYGIKDLMQIIFGGKNVRHFVLKVPRYCRYKCDYVFVCRNYSKEWKTRKGCLIANDNYFLDKEQSYYEAGKECECDRIKRNYRNKQKNEGK